MSREIVPVLTIAGSDTSGGAGIQADLKTFLAQGVYGMSVITALTAQNTQGVQATAEVTPEFLAAEIDAVFTDIPPRAVKIGMASSRALIEVIAAKLQEYQAAHVVVDPVMVATSGAPLLAAVAMENLLYWCLFCIVCTAPSGLRRGPAFFYFVRILLNAVLLYQEACRKGALTWQTSSFHARPKDSTLLCPVPLMPA